MSIQDRSIAVRIECAYVVVDSCDDDCSNHHEPVGKWDVNLTVELVACVNCLDLREVAGVHDLCEKLERTGLFQDQHMLVNEAWRLTCETSQDGGSYNQCLRCHDGGQDGDNQRRIEHAGRHRLKERVRVRPFVLGNVSGLADVG